MNPKRIVIDGKTYNSVDEMPEDVRRNYEQAMRGFTGINTNNGMPDVMANNQAINISGGTKFVVDGQVFNNVDDLPPAARAKYEQAMGSMDKDRNGIPDFFEGMMNGSKQTQTASVNTGADHPRHSFFDTSKDKSQFGSPTIEPESSGNWIALIAGIALAGICLVAALAGVWYFYLR